MLSSSTALVSFAPPTPNMFHVRHHRHLRRQRSAFISAPTAPRSEILLDGDAAINGRQHRFKSRTRARDIGNRRDHVRQVPRPDSAPTCRPIVGRCIEPVLTQLVPSQRAACRDPYRACVVSRLATRRRAEASRSVKGLRQRCLAARAGDGDRGHSGNIARTPRPVPMCPRRCPRRPHGHSAKPWLDDQRRASFVRAQRPRTSPEALARDTNEIKTLGGKDKRKSAPTQPELPNRFASGSGRTADLINGLVRVLVPLATLPGRESNARNARPFLPPVGRSHG